MSNEQDNNPERTEELKSMIAKAIDERNHFWWGCVIGVGYGKKLEFIRISENENVHDKTGFDPIVIVKYGRPYKSGEPKGKIIKWINEKYGTDGK